MRVFPVDTPLPGQVTEASPAEPFLRLKVELDPGRSLSRQGRIDRELPAESFPVLTSLADELGRDDFPGLLRQGVEIWLEGLERRLDRSRQPGPA